MSGEKVSLIVWRDAKTDPPPDDEIVLVEDWDGIPKAVEGQDVIGDPGRYTWWAELPTPSEATLDDLRLALGLATNRASRQEDGNALRRLGRLRALLPGDNEA